VWSSLSGSDPSTLLLLGVGLLVAFGFEFIDGFHDTANAVATVTCGQGTSAQLVAAGTILAADVAGAPVSTTHVLSSAVAGTMAAGGSGLQPATLRSIALAWVLTLPASIVVGAVLFLASRALLG
jgi:PiT family inorganic phosphate transporter